MKNYDLYCPGCEVHTSIEVGEIIVDDKSFTGVISIQCPNCGEYNLEPKEESLND